MANRIEPLQERQIDETWEMNMHLNPIDEDTEEILNRHKNILLGQTDDFIAYIHHIENSRIQKIQQKVYEEKLKEFARVDDLDHCHYDQEPKKDLTQQRNKKNISKKTEKIQKQQKSCLNLFDKEQFENCLFVKQAIDLENSENVIDLTEFAKTTVTQNMDPERFTCILSKYSEKQPIVERNYLKVLPYYQNENQSKYQELLQQKSKEEQEKLKKKNQDGGYQLKQQVLNPQVEIKCPPRKHTVLDPYAEERAKQNNEDFQKFYYQVRQNKMEYLDRMNQSELYKGKESKLNQSLKFNRNILNFSQTDLISESKNIDAFSQKEIINKRKKMI